MRKVLAFALAVVMSAGSIGYAAPACTAYASQAGNGIPWTDAAAPVLDAKKSGNVDTLKFTHKEWTGTEYTDVGGTAVKAAEVYGINREEAGMFASTSVVYDSLEHAITGARDYKKAESRYVQFLTGEAQKDWSLTVVQNQDVAMGGAYKDFYKSSYRMDQADGWESSLQLPCSWTGQGFDFPIYANVQLPWQDQYDSNTKNQCPRAPEVYNPVGLYRKAFDVNDTLKSAGGRIYLSFQGVESAYYVYVNGKEVGYS